MKPPKKFLAILLIIQIYFCFAECRNAFGQYSFDSWTTDNGLPQNGIREIVQTPDGYLWFTTFDGLVRFDGVKFTTYGKGTTKGIINNRFTGMFADKDGTIYASTMEDGTLTIYKSGIFSSYTSDQIPDRYIKLFKYDENGELAVLTDTGEHDSETWYYLRGGKFVFKEKIKKTDIKIDYRGKTGALWKISQYEIVEQRNEVSNIYHHNYEIFDSTIINFEDSGGALWIGGKSLTRLKNGTTETFGEKEGFPTDSDFHSFWEENDGSVWFANGGRTNPGLGLVRYKDGKFTSFGKESGLSDTSIYKVFKDREGTVWIATNKGLNRLRKNIITSYSTENGLRTAEVYPIFRTGKDEIWVGTTKGLSVYRNGHFENVDFVQTGKINSKIDVWRNREMSVQALFEDSNGKMWIGVAGAIYTAENGKVELVESSEGHHTSAFYQDKNGIVWAATSKGILRFNNYKLENFYSVKDGLPNEFMTCIFADSKGRLWFGGFGGLSLFQDGKFINYTTKEGLAGNYVRSIYEDKDATLWIGTYDEGLSRLKDGIFTNYKAENGLYNNGVFAIREDERGYFWISSNRGIYRVSRRELNDFADGKISKITSVGYGKQDGMINNECNGGRQPASITDKDGNFWFPTQDGVAIVNPSIETFNSFAPPVVIESVTVERQNADIIDGLKVEAGLKNIEINFTGISLIKSEQIKFKYKLEGHDTEWIDAGTKRTAYYSYLPPGNYIFRVKAANSDGVWNEEGATLNIELKPFFYQTAWFYLVCIATLALTLLIVWKTSVYQLELNEKRLARLVDEKTEELRKANEELQFLANSDGLTHIGNRRLFEEFLQSEWHRAIRFKTEISLILLDIDHFKLFNDTYGHQNGDDCLKNVSQALRDTIHRPTDLLARFGGEEFAIILGGTDMQGAINIAEQAMENVRNLQIIHESSETCGHLTISIGVATTFVSLGMSEADLIKAADEALYKAKAEGRNRIVSNNLTLNFEGLSELEKESLGLV